MILLHCPRRTPLSRHRDENRVTAIPLEATLTQPPISVDSKLLTGTLNPLDATLTKNKGEGACPLPTHHLHVPGVHIHGDGSLDQLERYDHPQLALLPFQHALESRERTARDQHS